MITAWFSNICIFRSPKRGYHVNEWPKLYAILKRCCVNTLLNSNEIKSTQVHWEFMLLPIFLQNSKNVPIHANCYSFQLKWTPEAVNLRKLLFLFTQSMIYRDRVSITFFHNRFDTFLKIQVTVLKTVDTVIWTLCKTFHTNHAHIFLKTTVHKTLKCFHNS